MTLHELHVLARLLVGIGIAVVSVTAAVCEQKTQAAIIAGLAVILLYSAAVST